MPNRTATIVVARTRAPRARKAQEIIEVVTRSRPRLRFFGQTLSLLRPDSGKTHRTRLDKRHSGRSGQPACVVFGAFCVARAGRKKDARNHRSGDKVAASFALLWSDTLSPPPGQRKDTQDTFGQTTLRQVWTTCLCRFWCVLRVAARGPREGRRAFAFSCRASRASTIRLVSKITRRSLTGRGA